MKLRIRQEWQAGNLTRTEKDALLALVCYDGPAGLFPSDATVAGLASCSDRTVRRARAKARTLGLLTWSHTSQLVRGRRRQGPNQYEARVPAEPVRPAPGGQAGRRIKKVRKKEPRTILALLPLEAARAALAASVERRQHAIVAAWQARRPHVGMLTR
ncbi:helix-turn-helix domain-containing protein [Limobrevibacterium gyesilva]|uniref:helix-turn-helix domain-containing protein n=1 Tax=Limobrevibacterium gyesilva TaxID=2991712 RepID=UPI002225EFF3|nr:helix-turn-helix domain-containing protein [Limobrevibacterium gyesilva]